LVFTNYQQSKVEKQERKKKIRLGKELIDPEEI
jgi:hypothetical protein